MLLIPKNFQRNEIMSKKEFYRNVFSTEWRKSVAAERCIRTLKFINTWHLVYEIPSGYETGVTRSW